MTWKPRLILVKVYTSRGYGCGIYNTLIFVESKALKQAHSWLCNCFSNTAIGKNSAVRNPQPWPREVYVLLMGLGIAANIRSLILVIP